MTTKGRLTAAALLLALSAWGCSRSDHASQGAAAPEVAAQKAKYLLPAEPAEATGVADARQSARDTQELTVIGRVGGAEEPIVERAAAFLIVDEAAKPCQDGCKTPWDYCCSPQLSTSKAMVKVVDERGVPVAADARRLLGISELQTVVVRGRAKRDEAGNLTILADGVYVRR